MGLVVAAAAVLVPTWALAGNQEVAEQIKANLRESGQLQGYRIGIKFQDGTAWLNGQVSSPEQMTTALKLAAQTPGVVRVVNNLTLPTQTGADATSADTAARPSSSTLSKVQAALTQPFKRLEPASGAVAPEQLTQSTVFNAQSLDSDSRTQSAQRLQRAAISPLPKQQSEPGSAQRVATAFAPAPVQPTAAVTTQQPTPAPVRGQRQPLPIAYAQAAVPAEPVEAAAEGVAAPQPMPQPMPQQMPGAMPQQMPGAMPQQMPGAMPQYGGPIPAGVMPGVRYDQPRMPNYAWPGYAAYPNYAGVTYPKQYSPMAWPYIGPFYPYPQCPMGWRKVTLEWHDGWWFLDFDDGSAHGWFSGLFRHCE
jgi:hypothetical protein